jgi:diguanylate cyclase (GGDEF)-like protein
VAVLGADDPPRLAVLDWMMPGMDGVEVCRRVGTANREPYIYIVLLVGRTASQDLIGGMDAGAGDPEQAVQRPRTSRAHPCRPPHPRSSGYAMAAATHDGLTGFLKCNSILEKLEEELAHGQRESRPVSLLMVDLDRFKSVNDTYSHLAGDAVLREAAARLKSATRRYDSTGRYGGEEFLVVLPGCDCAAAAAQAERLRQAVAAVPFPVPHALTVTCSIGAARSSRVAPDALLRRADEAL